MDWLKALILWRTFRLFILSIFTGLALFIYAIAEQSFFWLILGVCWIVATLLVVKNQWKRLRFQVRLLLTDE